MGHGAAAKHFGRASVADADNEELRGFQNPLDFEAEELLLALCESVGCGLAFLLDKLVNAAAQRGVGDAKDPPRL